MPWIFNLPLTFPSLGFPGGSVVKESPTNAGDTGDTSSIPGLGRSLEEDLRTRSSILVWKIPWTEESCGLQSLGLQTAGHD